MATNNKKAFFLRPSKTYKYLSWFSRRWLQTLSTFSDFLGGRNMPVINKTSVSVHHKKVRLKTVVGEKRVAFLWN